MSSPATCSSLFSFRLMSLRGEGRKKDETSGATSPPNPGSFPEAQTSFTPIVGTDSSVCDSVQTQTSAARGSTAF